MENNQVQGIHMMHKIVSDNYNGDCQQKKRVTL